MLNLFLTAVRDVFHALMFQPTMKVHLPFTDRELHPERYKFWKHMTPRHMLKNEKEMKKETKKGTNKKILKEARKDRERSDLLWKEHDDHRTKQDEILRDIRDIWEKAEVKRGEGEFGL